MKVEGKKDPAAADARRSEEFLKGFKTSLDYVLRFVLKTVRRRFRPSRPRSSISREPTSSNCAIRRKTAFAFISNATTHLPVKMQVRRNDDAKIAKSSIATGTSFRASMTPLVCQPLYGRREDHGNPRGNRGLQLRPLRHSFYAAQPVNNP